MSIVKKTKVKIKMLELGLVPAFTGSELVEMLESLTDEQRVVAKRKFRKQWRKLLKSGMRGNAHMYDIFDPNESCPGRAKKRNRACMVISKIFNEIKD